MARDFNGPQMTEPRLHVENPEFLPDMYVNFNLRGTTHHRTIRSLKRVPLERSVILKDNRLTTAAGKEVVFPATGGRLLTQTDATSNKQLNQLVDYLANWAEAGDMKMDDIRAFIDNNGTEQLILKCVEAHFPSDAIRLSFFNKSYQVPSRKIESPETDEPEEYEYYFKFDIEYCPKDYHFATLYSNDKLELPFTRTDKGFIIRFPIDEVEPYINARLRFITFLRPIAHYPNNEFLFGDREKGNPVSAEAAHSGIDTPIVNREVFLTLPHPDLIHKDDRFAIGVKTEWLMRFELVNSYTEELISEQFESFDHPQQLVFDFSVQYAALFNAERINFMILLLGNHINDQDILDVIMNMEGNNRVLKVPVNFNGDSIQIKSGFPLQLLNQPEIPSTAKLLILLEHTYALINIQLKPAPHVGEAVYMCLSDLKPKKALTPAQQTGGGKIDITEALLLNPKSATTTTTTTTTEPTSTEPEGEER